MQCDKKENALSHTLSDVRLFLQPSCQIQLSFTFAPTICCIHSSHFFNFCMENITKKHGAKWNLRNICNSTICALIIKSYFDWLTAIIIKNIEIKKLSSLHNRHRFICYSSTFLSTLSCQIHVFHPLPLHPPSSPQLLAEAQLGLLAESVWVVVVWKIPGCLETTPLLMFYTATPFLSKTVAKKNFLPARYPLRSGT